MTNTHSIDVYECVQIVIRYCSTASTRHSMLLHFHSSLYICIVRMLGFRMFHGPTALLRIRHNKHPNTVQISQTARAFKIPNPKTLSPELCVYKQHITQNAQTPCFTFKCIYFHNVSRHPEHNNPSSDSLFFPLG